MSAISLALRSYAEIDFSRLNSMQFCKHTQIITFSASQRALGNFSDSVNEQLSESLDDSIWPRSCVV